MAVTEPDRGAGLPRAEARALDPPRPPRGRGALARREVRLAWGLLPTVLAVLTVVVLPLLAVFWISAKPVGLADLRPTAPVVRESLRGRPAAAGDEATIQYRLRNSSRDEPIRGVVLTDTLPGGLEVGALDGRCTLTGRDLRCDLGDFEGGARTRVEIPVVVSQGYLDAGPDLDAVPALVEGEAENILTSLEFTGKNFARVFDGDEFWGVLGVTLFYTVFGTVGALVMGLFAALLLDKSFRGQGILRGLYLFPYVAPVIAVAFARVILFDPFSGSADALLLRMGVTSEAINFFGQRPLALVMVTVFEIWRYFPLSFLCSSSRACSRSTRTCTRPPRWMGPRPFSSSGTSRCRSSSASSRSCSCCASSGPSTSSTTSSCSPAATPAPARSRSTSTSRPSRSPTSARAPRSRW